MSDFGINGIPNYGFAGGSAGLFGGNAGTGTPAMSSAQIMASLYGNYSPGAAQSTLSNIYGGGGFGAQPAYYAALGAAYGRQVPASSPAAVAAAFPQYNAPRQYGWDANEGAFNPFAPPEVNAARQYGWMPNEGAPVPAQPAPYSRGQFNPQTYGWDHNEGAAAPAPAYNPYSYLQGLYGAHSGSLGSMGAFGGYQPYQAPLQQPFGGMWQNRISPQIPSFPSSVTVPGQQSSYGPGMYAESPFGSNSQAGG